MLLVFAVTSRKTVSRMCRKMEVLLMTLREKRMHYTHDLDCGVAENEGAAVSDGEEQEG